MYELIFLLFFFTNFYNFYLFFIIFFFFNDTATTEIYTLSLHDALPISGKISRVMKKKNINLRKPAFAGSFYPSSKETIIALIERLEKALTSVEGDFDRSEEHTSELQSH